MSRFVKKCLDLIPSAIASRIFGAVSDIHFPAKLQTNINKAFVSLAHIDMDEAIKPVQNYATLNEIFTRQLKPGARHIYDSDVISPVDGRVSAFGRVDGNIRLYVKKQHFDINELVGTTAAQTWLKDAYYFIIYLSPANYHRIHAPLSGHVTHASYVPGRLLPVNRLGLALTDELFPTNERLTTFMESNDGHHVAIVKVGATCVGRISVTYDFNKTNDALNRKPYYREIYDAEYNVGEELATFNLGSTIILFVENKNFKPSPLLTLEQQIRMGEPLGRFENAIGDA